MKTLTTLYEVLGIAPNADTEAIRKAYRLLARRHHPDVSADPRAHDQMARINEAFETLIDAGRRTEYDAALAGGHFESEGPRKRKEPPKPVVVKLQARLKYHKTPVYAVGFAPDTGTLVSSAFDNEIAWWDAEGKASRRMKLDMGVISTLRMFPEGRLVAAGSLENSLSFWSLNGDEVDSWRGGAEEWVSCLAIAPDGKWVATGSIHRTLAVFNAQDGRPLYRKTEHTESVTAVAWSADGALIATGSADATVKIWHGPTGALMQTLRNVRATVTALAFSQDGHYLAAAAVDYSIRVFDLSTGLLVKMMFGHTKPIETIAFHSNCWLIASGSRDGTVGLWNAAKGIGNVRIDVSNRPISCVAFSSDGAKFAAGGQDKTVRIWDVVAKESTEP